MMVVNVMTFRGVYRFFFCSFDYGRLLSYALLRFEILFASPASYVFFRV